MNEVHIHNLKELIKVHKDNDATYETLTELIDMLQRPNESVSNVGSSSNEIVEKIEKFHKVIKNGSEEVEESVYLITQEGKYLKTYNEFGYIEETDDSNEAELFECGNSDVDLYKDEQRWAWKDEPLLALNEDDFATYYTIVTQPTTLDSDVISGVILRISKKYPQHAKRLTSYISQLEESLIEGNQNLQEKNYKLQSTLDKVSKVVNHKLNCLDGEITDVEAKIQSGALNTFVLKGRLEDLTNEYIEWQSILKEETSGKI